jgi:hypothetical protein
MVEHMNIPVGTIKPSFQFTLTQNFNFFNGDIDLISKLIVMFKQNGATANDLTIITPYNQYLDQMNKEMQQIFN